LPNTTPDNPYLTDFLIRDFPRQTRRTSAGVTLDYKLGPRDRVSLAVNTAFFAGDYSSRDLTFSITRVLPGNFGPTFTRGFAAAGSLTLVNADRDQDSANLSASLIYRHTGPIWRIEAGAGDSRARTVLSNLSRGYFGGVNATRAGVTIAFEDIGLIRPGRILVTDGTTGAAIDPYSLSTYSLVSGSGNSRFGRGYDDESRDLKRSAYVSAGRDLGLVVPLSLKAGLDVRQGSRDRVGGTAVYTFVGADGKTSNAPTGTSDDSASVVLDELFSQRDGVWGFPATQRPSNGKLWELYQAKPAYFTTNDNNAYRSSVGLSKYAEETTYAAFLRGDTALLSGRLKLSGGVRAEQTNIAADGPLEDLTLNYQRDATGRVLLGATGKPLTQAGTALDISKRTYLERRAHVAKEYLRFFPRLNASYNLTANLVLRAAYYDSLGDPITTSTPVASRCPISSLPRAQAIASRSAIPRSNPGPLTPVRWVWSIISRGWGWSRSALIGGSSRTFLAAPCSTPRRNCSRCTASDRSTRATKSARSTTSTASYTCRALTCSTGRR
jgi:hypothetical protein